MTDRRREEPRSGPVPLSVRFVLSSRASYGATGRKGGGWGAGRTAGKAAANLIGSGGPCGLSVRVRRRLSSPSPTASAGPPARARPGVLRRRAVFLSSLPMATRPRVLAPVPACRWPGRGRGGVVFSSGPDFWVLDKITVTCVAVKAASLASSVRVSLGPD